MRVPSPPTRLSGSPPLLSETQLSVAEARATASLDLVLHPSEANAAYLDALGRRMAGRNPDALRVRPPPVRASSATLLLSRLRELVGRHGLKEGEGPTRARMFMALAALDSIHTRLEGARRGTAAVGSSPEDEAHLWADSLDAEPPPSGRLLARRGR